MTILLEDQCLNAPEHDSLGPVADPDRVTRFLEPGQNFEI